MYGKDTILVVLLAVCCISSARIVDDVLNDYLQQRSNVKRTEGEGNPCEKPDEPFPCKQGHRCIPMKYVCDHNKDCQDGYDEDQAVCTAANRPPVVDMMNFLNREKSWIMKPLFNGNPISDVAHALAISRNVHEFSRRMRLPPKSAKNLRMALFAVKQDRQEIMDRLGMPPKAWKEVSYIFKQLLKSGFM